MLRSSTLRLLATVIQHRKKYPEIKKRQIKWNL